MGRRCSWSSPPPALASRRPGAVSCLRVRRGFERNAARSSPARSPPRGPTRRTRGRGYAARRPRSRGAPARLPGTCEADPGGGARGLRRRPRDRMAMAEIRDSGQPFDCVAFCGAIQRMLNRAFPQGILFRRFPKNTAESRRSGGRRRQCPFRRNGPSRVRSPQRRYCRINDLAAVLPITVENLACGCTWNRQLAG